MGGPYGILALASHAPNNSAAAQAGAIKAVGAGQKRAGPEILGQARDWPARPVFRQIQGHEAGIAGQEGCHPVLVLDRQDGTGGIDQPPARPNQGGRLVQQPVLEWLSAPPAAPGSAASAAPAGAARCRCRCKGASTKHQIEQALRLGVIQRQGLDDGCAGAGRALFQFEQRFAPHIAGDDLALVLHDGGAAPGFCRPRPPPDPAPACPASPPPIRPRVCAASSWNSKAPDSNKADLDRLAASPVMRMPCGA